MNIFAGLAQGLAKAGLDKASEVSKEKKTEKQRVDRILLKNENLALRELIKLNRRRQDIAEKNRSISFADIVSGGVRD